MTTSPNPLNIGAVIESVKLPPTSRDVVAKLKEWWAAIQSRDRARIELVEAEISGLAAAERRAKDARKYFPAERPAAPQIYQPSLLDAHV